MTRPHEDGEEFMSYMDTHAAFAPAGGIQELSFDEIDLVGGGKGQPQRSEKPERSERQEALCAMAGNAVGGALGIIGGIATTAVAGLVSGAFMGLFFASMGSVAATGACNDAIDKKRNGGKKPAPV